jgi:hypothetical protein
MYSMQGGTDYLFEALHGTAIRVSPRRSPAQHVPRHQDPAVFVELVTEEVEERCLRVLANHPSFRPFLSSSATLMPGPSR